MTLSVKEASFGYKKDHLILKNINFELDKSEVLSILGPNGVGKTTLLKCVMNMIKWISGTAYLNEKPIFEIPEKELWKSIAYVPQAKNTAFSFSAYEMVLLGRSSHIGIFSHPSKRDKEIADNAMERIGISHLKNKSCNRMSGGELQMVLIARALAAEPNILILDEPESNLDFKNQLIILDIIKDLSKKSEISCIFNTHYPDHALKVSTHSLILNRDLSFFYGKSDQVINSETLRKSFGVNVHINDTFVDDEKYQHIIPISIL